MRPISETMMSGADITTNPVSNIIDAMSVLQVSAQAIVTGTSPVGTLKIQMSNDPGYNTQSFTPPNWSDVTGASVAINATGVFLIDMKEVCCRWLRVTYTNTSGTGTLTVNIKANGI